VPPKRPLEQSLGTLSGEHPHPAPVRPDRANVWPDAQKGGAKNMPPRNVAGPHDEVYRVPFFGTLFVAFKNSLCQQLY